MSSHTQADHGTDEVPGIDAMTAIDPFVPGSSFMLDGRSTGHYGFDSVSGDTVNDSHAVSSRYCHPVPHPWNPIGDTLFIPETSDKSQLPMSQPFHGQPGALHAQTTQEAPQTPCFPDMGNCPSQDFGYSGTEAATTLPADRVPHFNQFSQLPGDYSSVNHPLGSQASFASQLEPSRNYPNFIPQPDWYRPPPPSSLTVGSQTRELDATITGTPTASGSNPLDRNVYLNSLGKLRWNCASCARSGKRCDREFPCSTCKISKKKTVCTPAIRDDSSRSGRRKKPGVGSAASTYRRDPY